MKIKFSTVIFLLLVCFGCFIACVKKFVPEDRVRFNNTNAMFKQTVLEPTLGRSFVTLTSDFNFDGSTQPLTFKILNLRTYDNKPAPELENVFEVKSWQELYTGNETSLKEIEDKRVTTSNRLFEIRSHSGQFVMRSEANSNLIRCQPDSGYVFDVEVSNAGGSKFISGMRLKPFRQLPYEPNRFDRLTGQVTSGAITPGLVSNVFGESRGGRLSESDVNIIFLKTGNGNSLTFKFLDTIQKPIDPHKFDLTKWATLVHGFDMQLSDTAVKYSVAYPIPLLTQYPTKYTNSAGTMAHAEISWDRMGFGNQRLLAQILFDFAIYEKGDWQIIFWFKRDNPRFTDG